MVIGGALAHHITRSLRMRVGETIVAVDDVGREHGLRLLTVVADRVDCEVVWSRAATGEPRLRITVVQALPRERMEDCIDVLVEAGAAEVRPAVSERVVSRADQERLSRRVQRWQSVAVEAAQLAGRGLIPRVHSPQSLEEALAALPATARVLACTFDATASIVDVIPDPARPLALCIGPEGGWGRQDLGLLSAAGAEAVHMGARVLRTRYAGALACAVLLARAGDLRTPVSVAPVP